MWTVDTAVKNTFDLGLNLTEGENKTQVIAHRHMGDGVLVSACVE